MNKLISYVLPVYNEENGIEKFWAVLSGETKKLEKAYEIEFVFINDGSRDGSLNKLIQIAQSDKRVKVLNFSRNFGHQVAISAGIDVAEGEAVIIMDTDLQDRPDTSLELIQKWEEGFEVVFAQRRKRKDSFFKKFTASLFYRVLETLADVKIPRDTGDFRLIDKKVVLTLRKFTERSRFMRGIVASLGYKQVGVLFDRDERFAGKTGYTLKKMLKLAADGIFSFSSWPIKFLGNLTIFSFGFSFVLLIAALVFTLVGAAEAMWLWVFGLVLFINSFNFLAFSILGQYVIRTFTEVQGRPLYTISEVIQF